MFVLLAFSGFVILMFLMVILMLEGGQKSRSALGCCNGVFGCTVVCRYGSGFTRQGPRTQLARW